MQERRQHTPTVSEVRSALPMNNNHHQHAVRKRETAIACLLNSRSVAEAAERCDLSLRTLQRWMAQPDFQEHYRRAKDEALEGSINMLRAASASFAAGLVELAGDRTIPPVVRLAACSRGMEIILRIHGQGDLERRYSELAEIVTRLEGNGLS
jgi:hypothetical protein